MWVSEWVSERQVKAGAAVRPVASGVGILLKEHSSTAQLALLDTLQAEVNTWSTCRDNSKFSPHKQYYKSIFMLKLQKLTTMRQDGAMSLEDRQPRVKCADNHLI